MQLSAPIFINDRDKDANLKVWIADHSSFLTRLKSRDHAAFKTLYHKYASALNGNILRRLDDDNKASLVLEAVFVDVWNEISEYDESKTNLFTWINHIAMKHINICQTAS